MRERDPRAAGWRNERALPLVRGVVAVIERERLLGRSPA